jgi:6-phosphogluconolactonase/glucosamine-6-phosphate isomerase/deaminase
MPKTLISVLEEVLEPQHQPNVRFFPVDERLVPIDHDDSNTGIYLKQLTPLYNQDQFAVIPSELLDNGIFE